MLIWPIQDDRMNMTQKFVHDQKDHTDKHKPLEHDQKSMTTTNNKTKWDIIQKKKIY